jgi:hypothetical protein
MVNQGYIRDSSLRIVFGKPSKIGCFSSEKSPPWQVGGVGFELVHRQCVLAKSHISQESQDNHII